MHFRMLIRLPIQIINVKNDGIFYASLPSTGWYILHFVPSLNVQGNYMAQYTISFRIKNQGIYVPFFVNVKDTKALQFSIPAVPYILIYRAPLQLSGARYPSIVVTVCDTKVSLVRLVLE